MSDATPAGGAPTVLLVQGGFADGSSPAGVIEARRAKVRVRGPVANPLRCLATDSDYMASAINNTDGRCSPSATPTAAR